MEGVSGNPRNPPKTAPALFIGWFLSCLESRTVVKKMPSACSHYHEAIEVLLTLCRLLSFSISSVSRGLDLNDARYCHSLAWPDPIYFSRRGVIAFSIAQGRYQWSRNVFWIGGAKVNLKVTNLRNCYNSVQSF